MAKFTPGPTVAAVSGSMGGTVFSHNRYGMYFRNRSIPTRSTTVAALAAKARMATVSAAWRAITATQQLSWKHWAEVNPIIDRLGQAQVLQPNAAFNQLNNIIHLLGGTQIDVPPTAAGPIPLATLVFTADIGATTFDIAYTATPLPADQHLIVRAAVVDSLGVNYVKNLLRITEISSAAQASPLDIQAGIEAVFGTLVVGQKVSLEISVGDATTGLTAPPLRADAVVVDTV